MIIFIFILGLIIGSFLNVVVYRLKNGGKIFFDRSRCIYCKKDLKVLDLIPVFSFLILKGCCRNCKKKISCQYIFVELGTAIAFVLTFLKLNLLESNFPVFSSFGPTFSFFFFLFIFSLMIVIFVYDLKYYLIPDAVLIPGVLVTLIVLLFAQLFYNNFSIFDNILGLVIFSGFFLFQYLISRGEWIGGGDVKLGILLGLILGWKVALVCLFLSYILGAFVAVVLIIFRRKTKKDILPFGPFLIFSFILSLFYGPFILNWYLNHLIN